jgi:hypothetical protein
MRKIIYISVLMLGFLSATQAQKKIIYQDTSLLQKDDEQVISTPIVDDTELTIDTAIVQPPVEETLEQPADTTLYKNDLDIALDSVKYWKSLKDYAYVKNLDSLLKNLKKKEKQQTETSTPRVSFFANFLNSDFLKLILWALAIGFVVFILYRLFLAEGVFKRNLKSLNSDAKVAEEIITQESDFDSLIRLALQNSNYRLALRYQYLRTLHLLAGKGLVSLAPDKTNFNYVSEISNIENRNAFAALTLNYEYAWYGEFDVDKNIYAKIESNFSILNNKI